MSQKTPARLITQKADLLDLCKDIDRSGRVALDLEFIPERTYFPVLCLIQCCVEGKTCIVDPLELQDLMPLWERIANPEILTILHAASQDLDLVHNLSGLIPRNIFDTQIAAGFAGYGYSAGYRRLLSEVLNVHIPKTESFSDWQERPLTASQLDYAVSDVLYLEPLYDEITKSLKQTGRLSWVLEECRAYEEDELYNPDRSAEFFKVKGASKLPPRALAILRELWGWRDEEARTLNKPARTLLADNVMIEIARRQTDSIDALKKLRGIRIDQVRRFAEDISDCVRAGKAIPDKECPSFPSSRAPYKSEILTADFLFMVLKLLSSDLDLATEHLATRDELQSLVRLKDNQLDKDDAKHRLLTGWRREVAGDVLVSILQGEVVTFDVTSQKNGARSLEMSLNNSRAT